MTSHPAFGDAQVSAPPVRRVSLTGSERQLRAAVLAMEKVGSAFARAARRSMPFLSRYRSVILPGPVEIVAGGAGPVDAAGAPALSIRVASADGLAWGAVTLNADAIALVLEGALGGRGAFWKTSIGPELTAPQTALVTRIATSLAGDFGDAVRDMVGLRLSPVAGEAPAPGAGGRPADVLRVVCPIEGLPVPAAVTLTANALAVEVAAREHGSGVRPQGDPRVAEALLEVPVTVVAELGRVAIGLGRVVSLKVGDVIRLNTATDDAVTVRVAGVAKIEGVPVVSRGQLAIEVRGWSEG